MPEDDNFSWILATFAIFGIAIVMVSSLVFNRIDPSRAGTVAIGDNCNILTCPIGPVGPPSLIPGPPGTRGEKGESGPTGPQGQPGGPGPSGPAGMCLANPMCASGPSGPSGATGATGRQGDPGFQGETGPPGRDGPTGQSGPSGPIGLTGNTGPTGPQGIPGVCDCFNQTVTYNSLNVTSNFHLGDNSTFTCGVGSFIDNSCLTVGNCPNFTLCDLQAKSLFLTGGMPTILRVGHPLETSPRFVIFGDSMSFYNYSIDDIRMYATNLVLEGTGIGVTVVRALNQGLMRVESIGGSGSILNLRSTGTATFSAEAGLTQITNTLGGGILINNMDPLGAVRAVSSGFISLETSGTNPINIFSDYINLKKSSIPVNGSSIYYMTTNPSLSIDYNTGITNMAASVVMQEDIIIAANRHIIAQDEYLKIGPNVDIGKGRIITKFNVLSLMSGMFDNLTYNEYISLEAVIINNSPLPNLTSYGDNATVLAAAGLSDGYVYFNDTNGVRISSSVYIEGDLTIGGNVNFAGVGTTPLYGTAKLSVNTGILPQDTLITLDTFSGNILQDATPGRFIISQNGTYSVSYSVYRINVATTAIEDGAYIDISGSGPGTKYIQSKCTPSTSDDSFCDATSTGILSLVVNDTVSLFSGGFSGPGLGRNWQGSVYNYFNIIKL